MKNKFKGTNFLGVNVLSNEKATSSLNGDMYEFSSTDNKFSMSKNGQFIGHFNTDKNFKFKSSLPTLRCNGVFVLGKMAVAGIGAAAAGGGLVGAGAAETIVGGATAVGAAMADVALPGAEVAAATIGGAGEVAATAAAERC